jgi:MFS family permease
MKIHIPPSLYHRRFRLLWVGLLISIAGSRMQLYALFWHIREITDQPIALGGVGAARILPIILFSLLGGVIADAFNRRRLMFISQTGMAVIAAILGFLTLRGQTTLWHIYALTAVQAVAVSFDLPARQSLLPHLVSTEDLPNAFSMQSIAFQTGAIIGPALSGLVIAYVGLHYTYLINAVTYLAVIFALIAMGPIAQRTEAAPRVAVSLPSIVEGIRFISSNPIILSSMLLDFFATLFSRGDTLLPIFVRDILDAGPVTYGWLSAAQSIGATAAAAILSQLDEIRHQGRILLVAVVFYGLSTMVFGLSRSVPLSLLALIGAGASDSVSSVIRNTIRQLQTPDRLRGRMVSVNQIFFMGGPQLGEVEAGVVAQLISAPFAVASGGLACILAVGWIARRWPGLRAYRGDEPILAGASVPS